MRSTLLCAILTLLAPACSTAAELSAAVFVCDLTPPAGEPLISGDLVQKVEHPLLAKGVVISRGRLRVALCSVDWCELCNSSHLLFRQKIAAAAGIEVSHVAVQTVHQHTAPLVDGDAAKLLAAVPKPPRQLDPRFIESAADRVAEAVSASLARAEPFDEVGLGEARVDRVAASRRVKAPDGKILVRWSACKDPALRAMPEGYYDPMLKTITLARAGKPLVRLHYYAIHPQSFYGDSRVSSDFPGIARQALEESEKVTQIYFTGCGGDVTAGKYNDGLPAARAHLAARLLEGMRASIRATRRVPIDQLGWRTAELRLPLRTDPGYTLADSLANMNKPTASYGLRTYRGALRVAFIQRIDTPIEVSCLELGPVRILHLPGEPMVAFQHVAQRAAPDCFVAVAGYGDCSPGYLCTAEAFREGGYEPTDSMVAPSGEHAVNAVLRSLLLPKRP